MTLLDNMPHKCRIDRLRYKTDSVGGNIQTPVVVPGASNLECWVQNASQREISEFQKRDKMVTHKVYFPEDPPLRVGDLITITTATPDILGQVLVFQTEADRSAGLGILFSAMCEVEKNPRHAEFLPAATT